MAFKYYVTVENWERWEVIFEFGNRKEAEKVEINVVGQMTSPAGSKQEILGSHIYEQSI